MQPRGGELCLDELTPGRLDQLQKIYRPPRVPGGGPPKAPPRKPRSELPRLLLAQLEPSDIPEGSEQAEEKGMTIAKSRRKHKRNYIVDSFWWSGACSFRERDKVVRVTEHPKGQRLVDAPADVIHTRSWRRNGREITFIYLELPDVRRVSLEKLARRLGYRLSPDATKEEVDAEMARLRGKFVAAIREFLKRSGPAKPTESSFRREPSTTSVAAWYAPGESIADFDSQTQFGFSDDKGVYLRVSPRTPAPRPFTSGELLSMARRHQVGLLWRS